jgi:hypothetical protein
MRSCGRAFWVVVKEDADALLLPPRDAPRGAPALLDPRVYETAFAEADAGLYEAKRSGRNRVRLAPTVELAGAA